MALDGVITCVASIVLKKIGSQGAEDMPQVINLIKFCVAIFFVFIIVLLSLLSSLNEIRVYLDIYTFIVIVSVPLLYHLTLHGVISFARAVSVPFYSDVNISDINNALEFFTSYRKTLWYFAGFMVICNAIEFFWSMDDPNSIGPATAVILLSVLYASLINLVFIWPFCCLVRKRALQMGYMLSDMRA